MPEPLSRPSRAPRWWAKLSPTYQALVVLVGAAVAGAIVTRFFGIGGVSAATFDDHVKAEAAEHAGFRKELDAHRDSDLTLRSDVAHVHEEQRATREDFRAIFPGRLPALEPEPSPTKAP